LRSDRELLAGTGRKHSNLDDAEYNFHVFSKVGAPQAVQRWLGACSCPDVPALAA
jgi:hypothetical protein